MRRPGIAAIATAVVLCAATVRADESMRNVSIYAGSRGTGVPEATRNRLLEVERYLAGEQAADPATLRFRKSVVGLEGETMLCVEFRDQARQERVLSRLRPMIDAVPLLSMGRSDCTVD